MLGKVRFEASSTQHSEQKQTGQLHDQQRQCWLDASSCTCTFQCKQSGWPLTVQQWLM